MPVDDLLYGRLFDQFMRSSLFSNVSMPNICEIKDKPDDLFLSTSWIPNLGCNPGELAARPMSLSSFLCILTFQLQGYPDVPKPLT